MKKILPIIMVCFFMLATGCSKDNGLVRTMKSNETKETLNDTLKNTETIVEDGSGKFNELCVTMEESIIKYDDLYKQVEGYVTTLENNGTVKKEEFNVALLKIQSDQDACSNKRSGIYTYNKNFNKYWTNLMDSYNYLKYTINNINDLSGKGTLPQARECLENCKKSFEVISNVRGKLKENILMNSEEQ